MKRLLDLLFSTGHTISIPKRSNGVQMRGKGCSGTLHGALRVVFWHSGQLLQNWSTSALIPGQNKCFPSPGLRALVCEPWSSVSPSGQPRVYRDPSSTPVCALLQALPAGHGSPDSNTTPPALAHTVFLLALTRLHLLEQFAETRIVTLLLPDVIRHLETQRKLWNTLHHGLQWRPCLTTGIVEEKNKGESCKYSESHRTLR